jgi:CSLREA domain-containing protein
MNPNVISRRLAVQIHESALRFFVREFCTLCALALVLLTLLTGMATSLRAQDFTVNSTADRADQSPGDGKCTTGNSAPVGSGNPECTLRAAIQESNADAGSHQITVPAGTYALTLTANCIVAVYNENSGGTVTLCLSGQINVAGAGAGQTIIDAGNADRLAIIGNAGIVEFSGVTLQNGTEPGGEGSSGGGGCLNNSGSLSLVSTTVQGCTGSQGGAIYNHGTLSIVGSNLTKNVAREDGGGVSNSGTTLISNSNISFNFATATGGGLANVANSGVLTVTESTISNNQAANGAGIANDGGALVATNTTVALNMASNAAGGIQNTDGTATFNNLTIAENTATNIASAGGFQGNVNFSFANSILAGNTVNGMESDCFTAPSVNPTGISLGYNLIQVATNCSWGGNTAADITGVNPLLGTLVSNGGQNQTVALLPGSPAIDAGSPNRPGSGGSSCSIIDQRGFFRPQDTRCDIGAFERTKGLFLSAVSPAAGGSGGSVTTVLSGSGFQPGATAQLQRSGQISIVASPVAEDPGQAAIFGTFNLASAALGAWDVVVTNPDNSTVKLPGAFTVVNAQFPQIYVDYLGRTAFRGGTRNRFGILIANRGNVDAFAVPVGIAVPNNFPLTAYFPVVPPPANPQQEIVNWTGIPLDIATPGAAYTNAVFLIPVIPAGYTGILDLGLQVPSGLSEGTTFLLYVNNQNSFFDPTLDPLALRDLVAGAQSYAQSTFGVTIPATLTGALESYISTQLQNVITIGRQDLLSSSGSQSDTFSLAQMEIDFAAYATVAALTASTPAGVSVSPLRGPKPDLARVAPGTRLVRTAGPVPADPPEQQVANLVPAQALFPAAAELSVAPRPASRLAPERRRPRGPVAEVACSGKVLPAGASCNDGTNGDNGGIQIGGTVGPPGCTLKDFDLTNRPDCRITTTQCGAVGGYHVSQDETTCNPDTGQSCPVSLETSIGICRSFPIGPPAPPPPPPKPVVASVDPNDKAGPTGVGSSRFVAGAAPLSYLVTFENEATASAPAQVVSVTDQLDVANLDLSTFALGPISFGKYILSPIANQNHFIAEADLRPEQNLEVEIQASLNTTTGVASWTLTSVDPDTGQRTTDPLAGFLPPDVTPPQGIGSVIFTVAPKASVSTNTATCNQATIVFDTNAALSTPTWCNSFDNTPPVSSVTALPATETTTSFTVQWSGADAGSGIASYEIYVSDNGGGYTPFQTNTTSSSATFTGQFGHTYAFYSQAVDLVGNLEAAKSRPDATTVVTMLGVAPTCAGDVSSSVAIVRSGYLYNFGTKRFYQTVTFTNTSSAVISGPIALVLDGLSSTSSLFNTSGSTTCAAPLGSPYISTGAAGLAPGASISLGLQFTDPTRAVTTYTTRVLAGAGID